jgi:hypothetical protein
MDHKRLNWDISHGLSVPQADPLKHFKFSSTAQRKLVEWVSRIVEVFWRSGNQGGKTFGGAALGVALARGLRSLGGVKLPHLDMPTVGWVLTKTYKQQTESVQAAFLKLIGDWPHVIGYVNKKLDYIGIIYIRPEGWHSDDYSTWSRIYFHCEAQGKSLPGGRIDWAMGDEPPEIGRWREVRARGKPNQPFLRFICATPLDRSEWAPLQEDFKGCLGVARHGRIELKSAVTDNAWLTKAHIDKLKEDWTGDPLIDARMRGDYVDATGANPFPLSVLSRWEENCVEPKTVSVQIQIERDDDEGRHLMDVMVDYEMWVPPEEDEVYLGILDPSLGINDPMHSATAIHIYARRRPRLVARFNGPLGPHGAGYLLGVMGHRYSKTTPTFVDVGMTGGYGLPALRGLDAVKFRWILSEMHEEKFGQIEKRLGFSETQASRSALVGAVEQICIEDSVRIWSQPMVSELMAVRIDERGRVVKGKGRRDDDMICLGRFGVLQSQLPLAPILPKAPSSFAEQINQSFGRAVITRPIKKPVKGRPLRWR